MWMILCVYLLIILLQAMTPYLTRKTAIFGVFIPEPYTRHKVLESYKKRYSTVILTVGVLLFIVQLLIFTGSANEDLKAYVLLCMMFVLLNVSACGYLIFRKKIMELKKREQWEENVEQKHVTDLSLRDQIFVLPSIFFILPMVITVALIVFTYMNFASIPNQVPIHWNYKGEADDWVEKSIVTVAIMPLLLLCIQFVFFIMNTGLVKSVIRLSVQQTETSVQRELKHRKGSSFYFAISSYVVTIFLVMLHYSSLILQEESPPYFKLLSTGFIVVVIGGVLFIALIQYKVNERFEDAQTNESMPSDDKYWKLGVFYFNKNDASFIIPKRFGIGWSMNFANKWAYVILIIIFVPLILLWLTD